MSKNKSNTGLRSVKGKEVAKKDNIKSSSTTNKDERYIPCPYNTFDPKKIIFDEKIQEIAKNNKGVVNDVIPMGYNYGTEETPDRGALVFETPYHKDLTAQAIKETVYSPYGVLERKDQSDDAKNKDETKPKRHCLGMDLNTKFENHRKFIEANRLAYIAFLKNAHKQELVETLPENIDNLNEKTMRDKVLRYPLIYQRTGTPEENKKKPGKIIEGISPSMMGSVRFGRSQFATKFCGIENNKRHEDGRLDYGVKYYSYDDVFGRGFEHIARIAYDQLFFGGKVNIIRMRIDGTVITKFVNNTVSNQGKTMDDIASLGISTQENALTADVLREELEREAKELEEKENKSSKKPVIHSESESSGEEKQAGGSSSESEKKSEEEKHKPKLSVVSVKEKTAPKKNRKPKDESSSSAEENASTKSKK